MSCMVVLENPRSVKQVRAAVTMVRAVGSRVARPSGTRPSSIAGSTIWPPAIGVLRRFCAVSAYSPAGTQNSSGCLPPAVIYRAESGPARRGERIEQHRAVAVAQPLVLVAVVGQGLQGEPAR